MKNLSFGKEELLIANMHRMERLQVFTVRSSGEQELLLNIVQRGLGVAQR